MQGDEKAGLMHISSKAVIGSSLVFVKTGGKVVCASCGWPTWHSLTFTCLAPVSSMLVDSSFMYFFQ